MKDEGAAPDSLYVTHGTLTVDCGAVADHVLECGALNS
jgi:hypothetical protein